MRALPSNINQIIDYLESKMHENIDLEQAARHAGYSLWEFQRIFSFMTNTTVGAYIRKRKLSLAAKDIVSGDEKIIDIALKYGYESPAAFSRAFKQQFGVSPTLAREDGVNIEEVRMFMEKRKFSEEDRVRCVPIIKQMLEFAHITRTLGVLALVRTVKDKDLDPLMKVAIDLITDGWDPMLVKGILENILETEQYQGYELLKACIIVEGALSIQAGEIPDLMEIKLASFIGLDYVVQAVEDKNRKTKENRTQFYEDLKTKEIPEESKPFEKILTELNDYGIQHVLREVEIISLETALMACGHDAVRRITYNLSEGLEGMILQGMKLRKYNLSASIAAQEKIIEVYNRLVAQGDI